MESKSAQIEQPSSIPIEGCTYIYAPAGQAGEYAPLAANPYRGCGHACAYCYVPQVVKIKRAEFDAGARPRRNYLNKLRKDAQKYQAAGIQEQVMLSFTTDVYNPFDMSLTRPTLEIRLCARICKKRSSAGFLRLGVFGYTRTHEGKRLDTAAGLARLQGISQ